MVRAREGPGGDVGVKNVGSSVGQHDVWPTRSARSEKCIKIWAKEVKTFLCAESGKLVAMIVWSCVEECWVMGVTISK